MVSEEKGAFSDNFGPVRTLLSPPTGAVPAPVDKCPVCGKFGAKNPDWAAQIRFKDQKTVFFGGFHFFTYKIGGENINFFVCSVGTGKLQAHFDACYSCFKYKLG